MRTTKNGYRLNKNGKPIQSIESEAIVKSIKEGETIKEKGVYYFFDRKQGNNYIYLP